MMNSVEKNTYDGFALPLTVFLGLLIPFFVPNVISSLIKPFGIIICVFYLISSKQNILKSLEQYLFFIFFSVYLCACLRYNDSIGLGSIGYLLYILFAASIVTVNHSDACIKRLVKACFWSGALFALFVSISNPFFVFNVYTRTNFFVLWQEINSNQIVYFVAIGLASFPLLVKNGALSKPKRWLYISFVPIMIYVILLTLSRGGFLCLVGILCVCIFDYEYLYLKKNVIKCFFSLLIIAAIMMWLYNILPFDQMSRILSAESYADSNGRSAMFSEALSSINNILVGDGCDAWTGSHKIHNIFISIFLQTGLVGLFSFVSLIIYELAHIRSVSSVYFFIPFVVESMVESGDAYTFWVPLIMISLLNKSKMIYV